MMVSCVAVVGMNNNPLFVKSVGEEALKFQYMVHTSLDIVEEKTLTVKTDEVVDAYLGMLYPYDEYRVYGFVTNTKVKFMVVIDELQQMRDSDMRTLFRQIHDAYIRAVCSPFYRSGSAITSPAFSKTITTLMNVSE
eukprot:m.55322 g.55322  ORF g.55322 m.55322 type:complete len:137 (+) comp13304_c0_seq4:108-518(+)